MRSKDEKTLAEVCDKFENYTKNPVDFLSVQVELAKTVKNLVKRLYDLSQDNDKSSNTLPELIVDNFDEEQIWQELELRNEEKLPAYIADVSMVLSRKGRLKQVLNSFRNDDGESDVGDIEGTDEGTSNEEESDNELQLKSSEEENSGDEDESEDLNDQVIEPCASKKKSVVDDTFFKLHELEDFLIKEEREARQDDGDSDDEEIDYFNEDLDGHQTKKGDLNPKYKDFFPPPEVSKEDGKESNEKLEGIQHVLQEMAHKSDRKRSLEDDGVEEKSMFEERQERLLKKIKHLENSNIADKPWQLKGEITASARPPNSLLEEVLEVDIAARPAPIITEKTTLKLEDIIRQRIKDKAWDDVERKFKPIDTPAEFKKKLVLDQEKSKMSLAEVYEQEYLKQKKELEAGQDEKEKELEEHKVIKKMMDSLFLKLDALSNFHYTPKPIAPEVQIISHVPAIEMEEVAPVATSDAKLLAPEEVKAKPRGDVVGKGERSETDKKRERRQKKLRQRARRIAREQKEKAVEKVNPGLGNKYSKEKAIRMLEKVSKEENVELLQGNSKVVKSSKAFFSQLQDEVTNQIKSRTDSSKKKTKWKVTAQKVKL
ncbi:U3 small nucleolar ribonucleoprotein protein MPP10 [Ischnura elegans]|uniref:U3 small nucleolar ribonucleoprotein protein MPP10 n=1 Tax=Ischnura elegans TaxID=197161 RepID=UPI001ED89EC2|nr:U3 small nucleolar ribonucleoprotein protein MPP10 [Ischnura elegans]